MIDSDLADREWASRTDPSKPRNSVTGNPKHRRRTQESPSTPVGLEDSLPANGNDSLKVSRGYATARAIRETFLAKMAQLEFEQAEGKLVNAEDVRTAVFNANRATRDLLLTLPARLAPVLSGVTDPFEIHQVLDEAIRDVCSKISSKDGLRPRKRRAGR